MSEFQYYEFYSIDKDLTEQEIEEVDSLSSRFSPTSRRAIFTYSYSDFKHDEETVLLKYFDFFLYLSNWGTKRIMYKIPIELVDYEEIKQYKCNYDNYYADNGILIKKKSKFAIIDINLSEEGGDMWIEEESQISPNLIGLRQDILNGDYRSLFIMWLHIKHLEFESEQIDLQEEIPLKLIPDNLSQLNSGLRTLTDLYGMNIDWISGASKYSKLSRSKESGYESKLIQLPETKKEEYLKRILKGEQNLRIKLIKEIDKLFGKENDREMVDGKITLEELLKSSESAKKRKEKLEKERAEKRRVEKIKETEKNRGSIEKEIDYHIERGTGKSYDEAMKRILELQELSTYKTEVEEFMKWMKKIRKKVTNKPAMMRRLENHGL